MQKFVSLGSFVAALLFLATPSFADSTYKVDGASQIKIDVYHPAKHVKATNKAGALQGSVTIKGALVAGKSVDVAGNVQISVGALQSGNGRRDKYMRRSLGGSSSKISFSPKSLTMKTVTANGGSGEITGSFTINNTTNTVTFPASFEGDLAKGGKVVVSIKTNLLCTAYKINLPSLMFVKIKDKVDLAMTLHFTK